MPSVSEWCSFMTSAARSPSSRSTSVNSQSGRVRSNAVIAALRADRDHGPGRVRRRRVDTAEVPGQVEVRSSTVQRGVASRAGGSRTRWRNGGMSRVACSSFAASTSQSGARLEPGDGDHRRSEHRIALHVPGERVAVAHEDAPWNSPSVDPRLRACAARRDQRRAEGQNVSTDEEGAFDSADPPRRGAPWRVPDPRYPSRGPGPEGGGDPMSRRRWSTVAVCVGVVLLARFGRVPASWRSPPWCGSRSTSTRPRTTRGTAITYMDQRRCCRSRRRSVSRSRSTAT